MLARMQSHIEKSRPFSKWDKVELAPEGPYNSGYGTHLQFL